MTDMHPVGGGFGRPHPFAVLLVALPFVWPLAQGPLVDLQPWLAAMACAAVWLIWWPQAAVPSLLWGWLLAALLNALIALLQASPWNGWGQPWIFAASPGNIFGQLRQRNQLGTLLSMGLAAGMVLWASHGTTKRRGGGLALVAGQALLGVGLALTSSRTALVQLVTLGVFAALLARTATQRAAPLWKPWVAGAAAFGFTSVGARLGWWGQALSTSGISRIATEQVDCNSRLTLWDNVWQLIQQKPWTGWGWRELDYAHFTADYGTDPRFCELLDNAHNLPLQLAVELGIPAALLIVGGLIAWVLWRRPWAERDLARQGLWMGLAMVAIHSLLEYPLWYGHFFCTTVLAMLALTARPAAATPWVRPVVRQGLAALLGVATAYAAWDYQRISQVFLPPGARQPGDAWAAAERSVLYRDAVSFARLAVTPLTAANAPAMATLAERMMHFSPEPSVVEKLILSLRLQGKHDEVARWQRHYANAYPAEAKAFAERLKAMP